jgi:hypothetical protein
MSNTGTSDFGSELKRLAKLLEQCPQVSRLDTGAEKEAWTLAHALLDLEESCRMLVDRHMPKLRQADLTADERYNVLLEVGEELRHVLYHIKDPRFFKYLSEP